MSTPKMATRNQNSGPTSPPDSQQTTGARPTPSTSSSSQVQEPTRPSSRRTRQNTTIVPVIEEERSCHAGCCSTTWKSTRLTVKKSSLRKPSRKEVAINCLLLVPMAIGYLLLAMSCLVLVLGCYLLVCGMISGDMDHPKQLHHLGPLGPRTVVCHIPLVNNAASGTNRTGNLTCKHPSTHTVYVRHPYGLEQLVLTPFIHIVLWLFYEQFGLRRAVIPTILGFALVVCVINLDFLFNTTGPLPQYRYITPMLVGALMGFIFSVCK